MKNTEATAPFVQCTVKGRNDAQCMKREGHDGQHVSDRGHVITPRRATVDLMPDYAGLRRWVPVPDHGTFVGVYDGREADMDTDAGRWQTVCEAHGAIISHRTLALARSAAAEPEEWCEAE